MNPFLSVWLHPKQTARFLIEQKTILYAMILVVTGFMASSLLGFQNSELYPDVPYMWLFLSMLVGPVAGIVVYLISTAITFFVGKLLGGTGEFWEVGKALSLSYIPMIVTWPIFLLWLFISPASFFLQDVTDAMAVVGSVVMLVSSVWGVVITISALAEAHRYSNWRAFFTLMIPGVLIFAALFAIVFFIIAVFTAANM